MNSQPVPIWTFSVRWLPNFNIFDPTRILLTSFSEKNQFRAWPLTNPFSDKAKVIYAPREVYFPFGAPGILDCHFRANPPLTNLRWEKDGFLFDPYNVQGVFYKRNGSLYFTKINDEHAGRYTCTPYNTLGTSGSSPVIRVIVQRPPHFKIKPKQIYITKLGDTVEMHCNARDPTRDDELAPVDWIRVSHWFFRYF